MLYFEVGTISNDSIDNLAVLLNQSHAAGLPVALSEQSFSAEDLASGSAYELAPFIRKDAPGPSDVMVVLEADLLDDAAMRRLRKAGLNGPGKTIAYGRFASEQARINAVARITYALGYEPSTPEIQTVQGLPEVSVPIFASARRRSSRSRPRVALVNPPAESEEQCAAFLPMSRERDYEMLVITSGKEKRIWQDVLGLETPVWHYNEIAPHVLAAQIDIAVLFGPPNGWARFQALIANLVCANCILIDASEKNAWAGFGNNILPGTGRADFLATWLRKEIVPGRNEIETSDRFEAAKARFRLPPELKALVPAPASASMAKTDKGRTGDIVFMPTNGVGLGHAKRCMVVAKDLAQPDRAKFAAFPSCIGMLSRAGFDSSPLVARRLGTPDDNNDLVNYLRLSPFCVGASGFVFDGGFVFPSVMNAVLTNKLPAIWIRRGLWQDSQNNRVMLDRQKIFERIIVPHEAFEELNAPVAQSGRIREVGPIVQKINLSQAEKETIRAELAERLGRPLEKLVVTMLGGGVAADRRAQISAVAAHLSTRKDVTNLVVVYPTSVVDPGWFNHPNTVVVRTFHASVLMQAADIFISAVGYNSFHEVLYGAVPTIFIPQMAPYMDDQRARGNAAVQRGLAELVEPWEPLKLTNSIDEFLAGRAETVRETLAQFELPETGSAAAARIIEEICK